jgi:hypothetical protein
MASQIYLSAFIEEEAVSKRSCKTFQPDKLFVVSKLFEADIKWFGSQWI